MSERFGRNFFLWQKTKDDVKNEMDSELKMPGWGNVWTQPIINRVNMLATGVRTQIDMASLDAKGGLRFHCADDRTCRLNLRFGRALGRRED